MFFLFFPFRRQFASALLVIPRILAMNGAHDAVDLVAKLRALHNRAQADPSARELRFQGLDLVAGATRNNLKASPVLSALRSLLTCLFFFRRECWSRRRTRCGRSSLRWRRR